MISGIEIMNAQGLPHAAKSRCQKAKSLNPTCAHGEYVLFVLTVVRRSIWEFPKIGDPNIVP